MSLPWDSIAAWRLGAPDGRPPSTLLELLAVVDDYVARLRESAWMEIELSARSPAADRWTLTMVASPKSRPDLQVVVASLSGTREAPLLWTRRPFHHAAGLASHLLDHVSVGLRLKPEFEVQAAQEVPLERCPYPFMVSAAERHRCVGELSAGARVIELDATPGAQVRFGETFRGSLVRVPFDFEVVGAAGDVARLRGTLRGRGPTARPWRVLRAADVLSQLDEW